MEHCWRRQDDLQQPLPCFSLSLCKHTLERHPAVARDSAKGRVLRLVVADGRGGARTRCHDYKCGLQVDDLGVVFTGRWAHIRAVGCLGVWEERKRSEG